MTAEDDLELLRCSPGFIGVVVSYGVMAFVVNLEDPDHRLSGPDNLIHQAPGISSTSPDDCCTKITNQFAPTNQTLGKAGWAWVANRMVLARV